MTPRGERIQPTVKRSMDIVLALTGLIVFAPAAAASAVAIRLKLGSPVLYRQVRPGLGGQHFTMVKFRTMNMVPAGGAEGPDRDRMTPLGVFLRATSLDEVPELWNVLKGEMSLVGPRPLLPRYTPFLSPVEQRRFEVRPGITGWAQVNGRNTTPWNIRLSQDVWYVENWSLSLDCRILLLTLLRVLQRTGVAEDPEALMQNLDVERAGHSRMTV